jgi:hypothetical protein
VLTLPGTVIVAANVFWVMVVQNPNLHIFSAFCIKDTLGVFCFVSFCFIFLCFEVFCFCFCFLQYRDWTQGLVYSREALYHLSYTPSPVVCVLFLRYDLANFAWTGFKLSILQPLPPK